MDLGLAGKTVIVTGGGSNIGRGISLAFAKEGVKLAIADLDLAQAEKTAAEAKKLGAKAALAAKTDVTNMANVEATVKKVLDEFGRIDILVNNVGFDIPMLFADSTPEFWDKLIAVNYRGMLNCTKAVLGPMIAQKSGAIVSIGSEAGRIGEFREAVYSGCKGGVISFSKAIARENGPKGIRVNVVCPGMTVPTKEEIGEESVWQKTLAMFPPDALEKIAKGYPLRRVGKAADIANAVVFLASDAANYITGQTISVSGGYSMM
ncbi:MAG: SDR family oxidoreductase [Dehalococcoidia bacterium]